MAIFSASAWAETVSVWFYKDSLLTLVQRDIGPVEPSPEVALTALAAGPTDQEQVAGFTTALPAGTTIVNIVRVGPSITIDFSAQMLAGLTEVRLEQIYRQVKWTLHPFDLDADIRLTVADKLLSAYLPAPPTIKPAAQKQDAPAVRKLSTGLAGRSITLSPGHGRYWNGSGWVTARPQYCAPLSAEDLHNLEMCQYLETYLRADGMNVYMVRCTNKAYGNHYTGHPWWQMGAYFWLQHLGYPCSVYASVTGDCNLGVGASEGSDDVRARPLASNLDGTDIYISVHTNGLNGDCRGSNCPTGTETYYDASEEHAAWGAVSQSLATHVHTNIMEALVNHVNPTWVCRGACVKNSNGAYGEIRVPHRAAILSEIAFHDTCDRDADEYHLRDNFFRSAAMWGIYKGVCDYFEVTPTWDFYSSELVNDTIPTTMVAGQTYDVSITFRNRGVVWNGARSFGRGAVDDSDPFTLLNRLDIAGEVGPGNTYTFYFQMRAPGGGDYVSDWQMVREGYAWFGETLSKQIHVIGLPPDFNNDLHVDAIDLNYFRSCLAGQGVPPDAGCESADLDEDGDVDQTDFGLFQRCITGSAFLDFSCWDWPSE